MSNMKYSGFNYIGKIPYNWEIKRLKNVIEHITTGLNPRNNFDLERGNNYYVTIKNFRNGELLLDQNCSLIDNEALKLIHKRSKLKKGDMLFASISDAGRAYVLEKEPNGWDINESVFSIRTNKKMLSKFLFYVATNYYFYKPLSVNATGSTFTSIKQEALKNSRVVLPKIKEQQMIADFLDEKVSIINNIICDLNNQIELLYKYKKQLISETVTRGLNKKVKTKNSGVKWIGSIPKHWDIKLIKNICSLKGRIGWEGLTKDEYISKGPTLITGINFSNGRIDWDSCEHVSEWRYNQNKSIQIKNKDLLITKDGTVGKVAIIKDCPEKVTLNSGVLLLRPLNNEYIEEYLYYVLLSNEFWHWFEIENIGNTTIIHLYQNKFAKFKLALPPIDEQKEIANYLDRKCSEIEEILNNKIKQKEQMEQYKKSVIYEYVTGKKRVEGAEELYE